MSTAYEITVDPGSRAEFRDHQIDNSAPQAAESFIEREVRQKNPALSLVGPWTVQVTDPNTGDVSTYKVVGHQVTRYIAESVE